MDIQGYILDHWIGKMSAEHPVLMVYDKEGIYYDHSILLVHRQVFAPIALCGQSCMKMCLSSINHFHASLL